MGLSGGRGERVGRKRKQLRRADKKSAKDGSDADDVKRQIDSDPNNSKPIYQLVNVNTGGGKLIELIKASARQHSSQATSGSHCSSGSRDKRDSQQVEPAVDSSNSPPVNDSSNNNNNINKRHKSAAASGSDRHKSTVSGSLKQSDSFVDEQIHQLVEPLLYNRGRGKLVPLSTLWEVRLGARSNSSVSDSGSISGSLRRASRSLEDEVSKPNGSGPMSRRAAAGYRWVCWKLEERGFVGETALHICFLLSTPSHMILAQKLLKLFPMLINDTYTGDEYFGESSLHMAIVNENLSIVKLLLERGANVHERCLGSFFLPNDQKFGVNVKMRKQLINEQQQQQQEQCQDESEDDDEDDQDDRQLRKSPAAGQGDELGFGAKLGNKPIESIFDLQSNHFKSLETNYESYTYWGEYPLSFAASLGLTDCYKLLLAKGADPNRQDSNGNSTLHICVIANRLDMFDLCYSNGANLNLINWLGLSALTLAAKLCRTQMFFHILTIQRHINWVFCNVAFVDYPLAGIDTINPHDGFCDDNSALSIVISGNSNEHLDMLNGPIGDLMQTKWDTSLRSEFQWWLFKYLLMLAISTLAYFTRLWVRTSRDPADDANYDNTTNRPVLSSTSIEPRDQIQINSSTTGEISTIIADKIKLVNKVSEFLLICSVIYFLFTLSHRFLLATPRRQHRRQSASHNGLADRDIEQQQGAAGNRISLEANSFDYYHQFHPEVIRNLFNSTARIFRQVPEFSIFLFTCLLVLCCIPFRLLHWTEAENSLATIIMFLLPLNSLLFCRASKSLGSFIIMAYKILANDVLPLVLFLNIFLFGFSQAFLMILKTHRPDTKVMTSTDEVGQQRQQAPLGATMPNPTGPTTESGAENSTSAAKAHLNSLFESIVRGENSAMDMFDMFIGMNMMALNEFTWMVDEFAATDFPRLANVLFCIYMIVVSLLLVNVFIATLGKTYQDMSAHPNENLRQWARALLILERGCTPATRANMLNKYSHVIKIHQAPRRAPAMGSTPLHRATATRTTKTGRRSRVAPDSQTGANSTTGTAAGVQFCRCYSATWALDERDWQEIKVIKQLKHEHELSVARLLARSSASRGSASMSASQSDNK